MSRYNEALKEATQAENFHIHTSVKEQENNEKAR